MAGVSPPLDVRMPARHHRSEKGNIRSLSPVPLAESLQCPLLTEINIVAAGKGECFQGPGRRVDLKFKRQFKLVILSIVHVSYLKYI